MQLGKEYPREYPLQVKHYNWVCTCVYVHACVHAWVRVHIFCACLRLYENIYVLAFVYIYAYNTQNGKWLG